MARTPDPPRSEEPGAPEPTQDKDGTKLAPTRDVRAAFIAVLVGQAMVPLDMSAVATAAPQVATGLGSLSNVAWVVTALALGMTVSILVMGRLADLIGRKPVFQAAIVLFVAGSVAAGFSQSFGQMIAFRIAQGLGGGGVMTLSHIILGDLVSPRMRGYFMAYMGVMFAIVNGLAPVLGGFIADTLSWRAVFWLNVPLAAAALFIVHRHLPPLRPRHKVAKLELASVSFLIATVVAGFLVLSWGGATYEWNSPPILLLGGATLVTLLLFVAAERHGKSSLFPQSLVTNRTFVIGSALGFVSGIVMHLSMVFVPVYLQSAVGRDGTGAGLRLMMLLGWIILSMVISNRLISRRGHYKIFGVLGGALMVVGTAALTTIEPTTPDWQFLLFISVLGVGIGMVIQLPILVVQNAVPVDVMGVGTAGAQFFRQLGATTGVAAAGALFAGSISRALTSPPLASSGLEPSDLTSNPADMVALSANVMDGVREALSAAVADVYLVLGLTAALTTLALAAVLPAPPLRESVHPMQGRPQAGS